MTSYRWRIADGKGALWTGKGDMLPFTTPLSHISRVKWHSELDYLPIVAVADYGRTLPAITSSGAGGTNPGVRRVEYTLGAHGRPGTPFCVAEVSIAGAAPIGIIGSTPVQQNAQDPYARFVSFGFDTNNLYLYEYSPLVGNAQTNFWTARPAVSLSIRTYISAVDLDGSGVPPVNSGRFYLDDNEVRFGDRLSSNNRYIREVSNPDDVMFHIVQGPTMAITVSSSGAYGWRYQCGPYSRTNLNTSHSLYVAPPGSFAVSRGIAL